MAEPAKALISPPSPAEVDKLAILYAAGKEKVLQATLAQRKAAEELEVVQQQCVALVSKFGSSHAEKSKLLHGLNWELMGTFGTSSSTDSAAVETLRSFLAANKQTRLLKRLFESTTRWALKSTARAEILKEDVSTKVRALFAACEVTKDRSPSIQAREKQAA
jgi:hypothetical protein